MRTGKIMRELIEYMWDSINVTGIPAYSINDKTPPMVFCMECNRSTEESQGFVIDEICLCESCYHQRIKQDQE